MHFSSQPKSAFPLRRFTTPPVTQVRKDPEPRNSQMPFSFCYVLRACDRRMMFIIVAC